MRLLSVLVTLFLIASIMFVWVRVLPANPCSLAVPHDPRVQLTQEQLDQLHRDYNDSLIEQYPRYVWKMISGGFLSQESYSYGKTVGAILGIHGWLTLFLFTMTVGISFLVAMAFGLLAATAKRKIVGTLFSGVGLVLMSLPSIVVSILLLHFFVGEWNLFPAWGPWGPDSPRAWNIEKIADFLYHSILPLTTLILPCAGGFFLVVSGSRPYALNGNAKLSGSTRENAYGSNRNPRLSVWLSKAIPNIQLFSAFAIGSVILTEYVFSYHGAAWDLLLSLYQQDLPLAEGCFFMLALMVVVSNLFFDLLIAYRPSVLDSPQTAELSPDFTPGGAAAESHVFGIDRILFHTKDILSKFFRSATGVVGFSLFFLMVVIAAIGPSLYTYAPYLYPQEDFWPAFLTGAGSPVWSAAITATIVGVVGFLAGLLCGLIGKSYSYPVQLLADFALSMPLIAGIMLTAFTVGPPDFFMTISLIAVFLSAASVIIVRDGVNFTRMSLQSNQARSAGISDRRIPLLSLLPAALSRTFFAVKFAAIIGIMTVITLDFLRFTSWSSWGHILGDAFDNAAFVTGELDWTLLPVVCIVLLVFGTYMIFDRLERIVLEKFGSGLLQ